MMKPHGLAAVSLWLFAIGCATTHRAASLPHARATVIPVTANSMSSVYGIQLHLAGSVIVRDNWLYLAVPEGSVRTYQGEAQAWDLLLRAELATCNDTGEWQIVSESRAARIAPIVGLTREDAMLDTTTRAFRDTLRLDLGVPQGTDLERAWVAFELTWPIESVLATYTLHTGAALTASSQRWDATRTADVLCRR